jgi:hypothetical protein
MARRRVGERKHHFKKLSSFMEIKTIDGTSSTELLE